MKKGAVAGAIVWSAPLLTSTPAFAATAKCSGSRPCVNWYYAKVENTTCSTSATGDGSVCRNLALQSSCDDDPVTLGNGCTAGFSGSHDGTSATFNFPPNAIPLFIQLKPGPNCYTYEWNGTTGSTSFDAHSFDDGPGPNDASADCQDDPTITTSGTLKDGYTVTVTGWTSGACQGISHIGAYFCI